MNMAQRDFSTDDMSRHFGQTRELPNAIEMEQQLLGLLIMRNELIDDLPVSFELGHFEEKLHRQIFEAMQSRRKDGRTWNAITLRADLPQIEIGGLTVAQYLARLASEVVNFVDYAEWCAGITTAAARRSMVALSEDLMQAAFDDELRLSDDIQDVRNRLAEVTQTLTSETATFSISDALDRALDTASGRRAVPLGVDPGLSEVMHLTGPWQNGQLIIIGGGVKQGKTALAMQCMFEIAKDTPVFLYSGEMTASQIMMRELARRTGISERRQKRKQVSESEIEKLMLAGEDMKRLKHIEIDCRKMTLEKISQKARAMKKTHGIGAVFVDHIGKIQWEGKMQYEDEFRQGQIATSKLKDLALELDIPVIALTHLKKATFQDYQGRSAADRLKAVPHRRPSYRDLVGNMDKDADQVLIAFQPRPILAGMEPGEDTGEYAVWEDLMKEWEGRAEIHLVLSRESEFPRRKDVIWTGETTSYGPAYQHAQNRRELF
ncbi:replicative DNA helicase [Neorhizobium sp. T786]|uniref:replicative DNA helicase n=1 Tax=Pseudorhizobium xiangyangii TaxID=2883104 RepID=UPI001D0001EC|nr:replicative DNA helicase [Neorhizobium xiangyangii]MCB5205031.1 replicative DNA helicase [Neorhizobium xiangyangii]